MDTGGHDRHISANTLLRCDDACASYVTVAR